MCPCDIPIKSIPPSQILSHQLPKQLLFFFPHVRWNFIHLDPMCLCNAVATQLAIDEGMIGLALLGDSLQKKKRKFTHRDLGKTPLIQQYQIRIYQLLVYLLSKHTKLGISPPKKWIWDSLLDRHWFIKSGHGHLIWHDFFVSGPKFMVDSHGISVHPMNDGPVGRPSMNVVNPRTTPPKKCQKGACCNTRWYE